MSTEQPSYIDWSAVFAGTAIASAMSLLLYGFGASVGLYVAQPWANSASTTISISIAVIIFVALAYIYSLALGSYFAGRMRPRHSFNADEAQFRDGASGFVVWAFSLIVGAIIASNVLVGAADRVATAGYRTAAGVSSAVAPFAEVAVDNMLRAPVNGRPASADTANAVATEKFSPTGTPQTAPSTTSNGASAATTGTTPTPASSSQASNGSRSIAEPTDQVLALSAQQREQIGRIVSRALSNGEISEADKQYLATVLETEFGYTPEQAMITVNQKMDRAMQETKQFLVEAKENTAFAGFWTAVVVLLSALASWWAATLGGAHRDEAAMLSEHSPLIST